MSRYHSYINSAIKIIEGFNGEKPFAVFIKEYFLHNKKYGAKDRRQVTSLCYNFFRLGFAGQNEDKYERILLAVFLCEQEPSELMERLKPEWNKNITQSIKRKLAIVKEEFLVADIFPFKAELGDKIDVAGFCQSFLLQPHLFIRIRPKTRLTTLKKLERSKLNYEMISEDCVQLPSGTPLQDIFIIDKEIVIQDYNSQQVLNYLKTDAVQNSFPGSKSKPAMPAWDCCAASGGKSILLTDIFRKKIDLTISDIRANILLNLHQRFIKAGIKEYKYFISDIGKGEFTPVLSNFSLVICDAPCTGSGTWSRTPEQLCYFKEESIAKYSSLQQKIVTHALPHLQKGGLFIYITCSVFKQENESVAGFIVKELNCKLLYQQLLKGYDKRADSMFVAVLEKL